jgi:hypothetical protein
MLCVVCMAHVVSWMLCVVCCTVRSKEPVATKPDRSGLNANDEMMPASDSKPVDSSRPLRLTHQRQSSNIHASQRAVRAIGVRQTLGGTGLGGAGLYYWTLQRKTMARAPHKRHCALHASIGALDVAKGRCMLQVALWCTAASTFLALLVLRVKGLGCCAVAAGAVQVEHTHRTVEPRVDPARRSVAVEYTKAEASRSRSRQSHLR